MLNLIMTKDFMMSVKRFMKEKKKNKKRKKHVFIYYTNCVPVIMIIAV